MPRLHKNCFASLNKMPLVYTPSRHFIQHPSRRYSTFAVLTLVFFDDMIFQLACVAAGKHPLSIKIISGRKIIICDKRFALNLWANSPVAF